MKGGYVAMLGCLLCACAQSEQAATSVARSLLRFVNPTVIQVEARGPYSLVELVEDGRSLRFFAPQSEVCGRVLALEQTVRYQRSGVFGRVSRASEDCELLGTASLRAWRDSQPRARGRPVPRGTARFEVIYRDEEVALVRGRFPFTGRIGIAGADIVALLPNVEACRRPLERGEASLEFRDAGPEPFRLLDGTAACPLRGLALPISDVAAGGSG